MIRGTTPTHTFKIPFSTDAVKEVRITYAQGGKIVLQKEKADCTLENNSICTRLTQDETLMFNDRKHVQVQLKVLTTAGTVMATSVYVVDVGAVLDEEVLT